MCAEQYNDQSKENDFSIANSPEYFSGGNGRISKITLKDIYKRYDSSGFTLHIESLELDNRSIHVVVGQNGSGKSTLLNILTLLERSHKGNVFYNGAAISLRGDSRKRLYPKIGFVKQNPFLFNMSVYENIVLGLKIRNCPKKEISPKANEMLSRLDIKHLAQRRVKDLSRGEYQKVAIAQVLALESELIVLDEPAANIDEKSTMLIEDTIKEIHRKCSPIIIMTTHSLSQANRISDDILEVSDGKITELSNKRFFNDDIKNIQEAYSA